MSLRAQRRLIGLPLAALVVYLFATNSQVVWLYLISAMILALAGLGLIGPIMAMRSIRLDYTGFTRDGFAAPLTQDRGKVFVGDAVHLHFRYRGDPSRLRVGAITLADGSGWPVEVGVNTEAQLTLTGLASRRGELHLKRVRIVSSWPIGVIAAGRVFPLDVALLCHPRYVLPKGGERHGSSAGLEEASERGAGLDFIGVRDYQPGDGQRQIHWPTTARRGGLMVVETARESQTPARYELVLRRVATPAAVELGVSVIASLAAGCAASLKPFRLMVSGEGVAVQRWSDALTALALANPAEASTPAGVTFDTRVTADREGVLVETKEGSVRLTLQAGLEEALAVLGELT